MRCSIPPPPLPRVRCPSHDEVIQPRKHAAGQHDDEQHGVEDQFDDAEAVFHERVGDGFLVSLRIDHRRDGRRGRVRMPPDFGAVEGGQHELRDEAHRNQHENHGEDGGGGGATAVVVAMVREDNMGGGF